MRSSFFLTGFLAAFNATLYSQVILTEVMFDPAGSENFDEFLEIYNSSLADTIDLRGWQIGDQTETDVLTSPDANFSLSPGHYAIILDSGYFTSSGLYDQQIPTAALMLTIDDAAFGSGGLSNSTPETILLISSAGDTIARYQYSLGNVSGHSDEKILLNDDDGGGNWGNSFSLNGTPGGRNSLAPSENDLALGAISFLPSKPRRGDEVQFLVSVSNVGLTQRRQAQLQIDVETNSGIIVIDRLPVPPLVAEDSIILQSQWTNPPAGRFNLLFTLFGHLDDNNINDTARVEVTVSWPPEIVRINEVMFAPDPGQAEWLEIYNPADERILLTGWSVQDESGKPALVTDSMSIAARGYMVVAAASSVQDAFYLQDSVFVIANGFPALNNGGDVIRLLDFSGTVIDSFLYDGQWGGGIGRSLEKVWYERENIVTNWLPSQATMGATPGAFNSRSPRAVDMVAGVLELQPPEPRAGENVRLQATGYNRGRSAINSPLVNFFIDADGDGGFSHLEKIGESGSAAAVQPEDSLALSFEIANYFSGRYRIAAVWAIPGDNDGENDSSFATLAVGYTPGRIVINEILYDSFDEVEWVELFNRSDTAVDVREWEFADTGSKVIVPDTISNFILEPGAFVLLTGSEIHLSERQVALSNFPSLNNDDDKLTLRDFSGTLLDSVHYFAAWGGGEGISLERINPALGSIDSSNWSGCVAPAGSTPGAVNSIFAPVIPSKTALEISPDPFSPDGDGRDDFAIIQFHLPVTTAAAHLKVYDMRGRMVRHLLNNAPTGANHQLVWDGAGDNGETLRMGIYVLFLQALNERQGIVQEARTTVVLAKKL